MNDRCTPVQSGALVSTANPPGMAPLILSTKYTQRLGYAMSDVAGQLLFTGISFYLLKFYTDIAGISALAAGNILLIARLVDALDAPLWGIVFERVRSRWGKFRPWFLWLCIPFAVTGV